MHMLQSEIPVAVLPRLPRLETNSAGMRGSASDVSARFGIPLEGAVQLFERDAVVQEQGEPMRHGYQVVRGCLRLVRFLEDGRRQVVQFLLPGDLLGWEAMENSEFSAEAVTPATLRRFRNTELEERAEQDRGFARSLHGYAVAQMRAARRRQVLLGRNTAGERIAAFLLEMQERLPHATPADLALPMCRQDIADYLGLTIETVSRGLTELRRNGTIVVDRSAISIRNAAALRLAGGERLN